jgi:geranylgeranyl diphosphate synthase, type I
MPRHKSDTATLDRVLAPYRELVIRSLRQGMQQPQALASDQPAVEALLQEFYGQIEYHLGWRDSDLTPARRESGKLLRPTLLLLSADLAAGHIGLGPAERQGLMGRIGPAAACLELIHNFSLIHDDIEDGDEERHHRATVWKLWGIPQAINTGDGLFSLARMGLWQLVDEGISAPVVIHLAARLDQVCLELCEGQHLDMTFEGRQNISESMYLEMISRKTAALMSAATEFGACLGAPEAAVLQANLARFGRALGIAFQLRDDLLGIWAAGELGKTDAGDLRRKKMSLPVIHAIQMADAAERATLTRIMNTTGPTSEEDIGQALAILERTGARKRIRTALEEQGVIARSILEDVVGEAEVEGNESYRALATLLDFLLATE